MTESPGVSVSWREASGDFLDLVGLSPLMRLTDGSSGVAIGLIDGPVEDFNLMVDRRRARGSLEILEVSAATQSCPLPGDTGILYALRGRLNVAADGNVFLLDAGETLRVEDCKLGAAAQSISLGAIDLPCRVAVVRIGAVSVE